VPTDHARPGKRNLKGATYQLKISPELTNALKKLSQQQNATLFMTMLAAFQTLLHRYTNQEHIVVGSPIAGRNHIEAEALMGFFVNTLALRTSFSGNPPFRQVLKQVREVALGAYTHQDLPFEKLVEELKPERSLNYTPLFQTIFTQQYTSNQELQLLNLTLTPVQIEMETVKFDLGFEFTDGPEGIAASLHYATDLFEVSTIRRMAGHLQVILSGIVANPQQGVSELPLLTKDEHRELLEWNDTVMPDSADSRLHKLFEAQVQQTPDSIALSLKSSSDPSRAGPPGRAGGEPSQLGETEVIVGSSWNVF
jgi:non-ribosomal peptide synthetase component F